MKKIYLLKMLCITMFMLSATTISAQEVRTFDFNHQGKNGIELIEQTRGNVSLEFNINEMTLTSFTYKGEEMHTIGISDISLPNEKGLPNVPCYSRTIAIPQGAEAVLRVVSYEQQVIKNVNVEPSLGVQAETEEPDLNYTKNVKVYSENTYYPAEFTSISEPSTLRGVDIVNIGFNPVRFNPVTKEAIVYHNIEIEIEFKGGNGQFGDNRLRSPYWDPVLAQNIMNYNTLPVIDYEARMQEWLRNGDEGYEYIIVIPNNSGWEEPAQRLKEYRTKQGIITEVFRLEDMPATTTAQMKTWFHNAYNTWDIAPVAVLLFADHNTNMGQGIPAEVTNHPSNGSCITDNQYADINGDLLPEMVFARLVAANATEAAMLADKQIEYEYTNPNMEASSYNAPVTALGWQTERWFQLCSEVVGGYFRQQGKNPLRVNCIYDGTPGSVWSSAQNTTQVVTYFGPSGTSYIPQTPDQLGGFTGGTPDQIVQAINSGTMLIQHRDHGLETGWGEPAFRNTHVAQLTNVGKMTFVMSINCLTGKFNNSTDCFAEAFMRRTYNGQNAGAVGMLCPTEVSYSFVNDAYVWGVFDQYEPDFMPTYGPYAPRQGNWFPAFGNVAGKFFLAQSSWPYNTNSKDITYQMFTAHCDAFLRLYTEVPQAMPVNHMSVQLAGLQTFQITAPEGAYIALTKGEGENLEIVAVAQGTGSVQNIQIPAQVPPTVLRLTVTGQNYLRYEAEIDVIPADGPYLVINSHELSNNATQLNFGDEAGLNIELRNVGNSQAPAGTATLTSESEYVTITNASVDFAALNSNSTVSIDNAFGFTVSDEVPNKTSIDFLVTISSGTETYENHITMKAFAPDFKIGNVTIEEIEGNGNGRLDPGERAKLIFQVENKGDANSQAANVTLTMNNIFLQITGEPTVIFNKIDKNEIKNVEYEIYVGGAPSGFAADYTLDVVSGVYTDSKDFSSKIGLNVEDFELGYLDTSLWTNDPSYPWTFVTDDPYEGNYCLKSGQINNNQETSLVLTYEVSENDSIAFYFKVSSETNYDKLFFYIDNVEKNNWSGNVGWTRAQYAVTEGTHTFRWKYMKDTSVASGSDCAWIDFVILPRDRSLAASAGMDVAICEGEVAHLDGFASNHTSMQWTTAGDGTFDDATAMSPVYTPGTQDIANGGVTLTLTAYKGTEVMSDDVEVSLKEAPALEILSGGASACMGVVDLTQYYEVSNTDAVEYETSGDGMFDGNIYHFGSQDIETGSVLITITAIGCGETSGELQVEYQGIPTVIGPEEINACSTAPISISINVNSNGGGYFVGWTTAGTGSINAPAFEEIVYTPSENDFNSGSVTLAAEYKDCQETSHFHNVTINFVEMGALPTPVGPQDVYNYNAVTEYSVDEHESFTSYEWILEPASAGTMQQNGNAVTITWNMNTGNGDVLLYAVGHSEICGDSEPSEPLVITLRGHGIDEINAAVLNIHPNPTDGEINVSIGNITSDVWISVLNSFGQTVYAQHAKAENGFNTVINIGNLSDGSYILQIRSDENVWIKKIIKK